jgi:DNA topoisomerase-3
METAGRSIEDDELRAAMKDSGLGTPATRAATIETLIKRGFIFRAGKGLEATPTGTALIGALPVQSLSSPQLTGSWEARLSRIARGLEGRAAFMADIGRYVAEIVAAIRAAPVNAVMAGAAGGPPATARATTAKARAPEKRSLKPPAADKPKVAARSDEDGAPLVCPRCKQGTLLTGKRGWGCSRWREGCGFVVWFDLAGKRLSPAQLRELVAKGKTRKLSWPDGRAGQPPLRPIAGRLVLDPGAPAGQGAVRFEPA